MAPMQDAAAAFCRAHGLGMDPLSRYIDLTSEVGELGKELLKATGYGTEPPSPTPDTQMELGDCLFSLLALCEALDIDAENALQEALAKYAARFREKGDIGS